MARRPIDQYGNEIYANLKRDLDLNNTNIHAKIFNYLNYILREEQENEIIKQTLSIGVSLNDKIIVLANLFFICVRTDKISLIQNIIRSVQFRFKENSQKYIYYMVNAYDRNYTPLMRAAYNCSTICLRLLLIWGANMDVININGDDINADAKKGYLQRCAEHPEYELFEKNKYKETIAFIKYWKENKDNIAELNDNIVYSEEDIDKIMLECVENTNTYKLTKLFEDLEANNINIPENIINKYRNDLIEDFDDLYNKYIIKN